MRTSNHPHRLEFVASMSVAPSDIRKIQEHLALSGTSSNPLKNVLATPLFMLKGALNSIKGLAESGSTIFFDSGGYHVQIGRLKYEELYLPLLRTYSVHRWASVYTLPDHVPTSQDSPEVVASKVQNTIEYGTSFFREMPDELKPKAMGVVQGHTVRQVESCMEAFISLGLTRVGFGSFGTSGKNAQINVATQNAVSLAKHVIQIAHSHNMKVHIFGIGTPALVAMLKGIKADSFDSATWLKCAGFGQVFLPFMRAYNISHRNTVSELQKGISPQQFKEWCALSGHQCNLCNSITNLQLHKMYRAVHNLITITETVEMINNGDYSQIQTIYEQGSPRYRKEFSRWLQQS